MDMTPNVVSDSSFYIAFHPAGHPAGVWMGVVSTHICEEGFCAVFSG